MKDPASKDLIKRLKYNNGQLLDEYDFQDEQNYHREMRKRHNRSVHSWGIVEGLNVSITDGKKITISAGMAIDKNGQELVLLTEEHPEPPPDLKSAVLTAKFEAKDDDTVIQKDEDGRKDYACRTVERPKFEITDKEPAKDGTVIVLTKLNWDGAGKITPDPSARSRSVSTRIDPAADLTVSRLSLAKTNDRRGALFLAGLDDFNHALYNNYSNIDKEGAWDGATWNTYKGLKIRVGSDKKSSLYINDECKVGIGTTSPQSTLSVKGGLTVGTNYAEKNAAPNNGLLVEGKVGIGTTDPGNYKLKVDKGNTCLDGELEVSKAATLQDTLTVNKGATLRDTLSVAKAATMLDTLTVKRGLLVEGSGTTTTPSLDLQFRDCAANLHVVICRKGKGGKGHDPGAVPSSLQLMIYDGYEAGVKIMNVRDPENKGNNQYITFHTHWAYRGSGEAMRIAPNGFVGIGTKEPSAPLHIWGGEKKENTKRPQRKSLVYT